MRLRRFRTFATFWAVLQFMLPAGSSYADALLEQRSAQGSSAHVEDTSRGSCTPVHAGGCVLCQLVGASGTPAAQVVCIDGDARLHSAPAKTASTDCSRELVSHKQARAPPVI